MTTCCQTKQQRVYFVVVGLLASTSMASLLWNSWMERLSGGVLVERYHHHQVTALFLVFLCVEQRGENSKYLLVKRKSWKALASSGHMVLNLPEEACCRATGSPMDSTFSREDTASFHVLSEGHEYFRPSGTRSVCVGGE